jgi:hypothetical protein
MYRLNPNFKSEENVPINTHLGHHDHILDSLENALRSVVHPGLGLVAGANQGR